MAVPQGRSEQGGEAYADGMSMRLATVMIFSHRKELP